MRTVTVTILIIQERVDQPRNATSHDRAPAFWQCFGLISPLMLIAILVAYATVLL
jgi:hypothetical protein